LPAQSPGEWSPLLQRGIGHLAGIRVRERIDQALFFKIIRVALFLIATSLVLKFIMGKM